MSAAVRSIARDRRQAARGSVPTPGADMALHAGLRGLAIGSVLVTGLAAAAQNFHLFGAIGDGLSGLALLGVAVACLHAS